MKVWKHAVGVILTRNPDSDSCWVSRSAVSRFPFCFCAPAPPTHCSCHHLLTDVRQHTEDAILWHPLCVILHENRLICLEESSLLFIMFLFSSQRMPVGSARCHGDTVSLHTLRRGTFQQVWLRETNSFCDGLRRKICKHGCHATSCWGRNSREKCKEMRVKQRRNKEVQLCGGGQYREKGDGPRQRRKMRRRWSICT